MGKIAVSTNLLIVDAEWLEDNGIKVRELPLKDGYYTFVTPLSLVKTYRKRWGIETGYRDILSLLLLLCCITYGDYMLRLSYKKSDESTYIIPE